MVVNDIIFGVMTPLKCRQSNTGNQLSSITPYMSNGRQQLTIYLLTVYQSGQAPSGQTN